VKASRDPLKKVIYIVDVYSVSHATPCGSFTFRILTN